MSHYQTQKITPQNGHVEPGCWRLSYANQNARIGITRLGGNNRERGQLFGPTIIDAIKDRFGTHGPAFMLLGGCAIVAALLAMALRRVAVLRSAQASNLV